jgi:photosystem II stability/assembly factor-like uncharacterized protein
MGKLKYLKYLNYLLLLSLTSCNRCNYYNPPYDIGQGGRTVSIVVHPTNENKVFAATESGGFFTSNDGARLWGHIDTLPFLGCDIDVAPSNPEIVIATTSVTSHLINRGGIWVSRNGGRNWIHPSSALPLDPDGTPRRYSAYGISFMPGTNKVYVGSDSGVVVSDDLGVSWRYINPEPDGSKMAIYSVLALRGGKVLLYGQRGLWISDDGVSGWRLNPDMGFGWGMKGALAVSPLNNNHLFFTNGFNSLWYSKNGGSRWDPITTDFGAYDEGREPFVKVVRSTEEGQNKLDLYYSNRAIVAKKTIRWTGSDFNFSGSWNVLGLRHYDPADIAFKNDGKTPFFNANDGGVEKSTDGGTNWVVVSKPSNFFNALQIFNVKGLFYTGSPQHVDMYFGTQDNAFWGTTNDGNTWPYVTGNEGFGIEGPVSYNNTSDSTIIYNNIGSNDWVKSHPQYANAVVVPRPTPYITSNLVFAKDKTFIQFAKETEASYQSYVYVTYNAGETWERTRISNTYPISGFIKVSGPATNPSLIVPYITAGEGESALHRLMRIENITDRVRDNESRSYIRMPASSNLGIVPTMWPWYASYGVDPSNPDLIIIPDIGNRKMWITRNGGTNWTENAALLDLVTDNGRCYFHNGFATPQVRTIDFDPRNVQHIAIGTMEAGVIYSRDGGRNWQKLPGTEQAPYITSFFFRDDTTAIASTYGRGLVKLFIREHPIQPETRRLVAPLVIQGEEEEEKRNSYEDTSFIPPLQIRNAIPGSAIPIVVQGKGAKMDAAGWMKNVPIIVKLDGKEIHKNMVADANGNFKLELPTLYEPRLYKVEILQTNKQVVKKESLLFKVAIIEKKEDEKKKLK